MIFEATEVTEHAKRLGTRKADVPSVLNFQFLRSAQ